MIDDETPQARLIARCTEHLQAVEASTDWADLAEILWWYRTDVKELLAALLPQPAERPHQWTRRQGREAVYDCPVCGMWTANLPLYKNDPCEKAIAPTPAPTYRVEQIAEALRAVKIVVGVTSEGELRAYRQPRQMGR